MEIRRRGREGGVKERGMKKGGMRERKREIEGRERRGGRKRWEDREERKEGGRGRDTKFHKLSTARSWHQFMTFLDLA